MLSHSVQAACSKGTPRAQAPAHAAPAPRAFLGSSIGPVHGQSPSVAPRLPAGRPPCARWRRASSPCRGVFLSLIQKHFPSTRRKRDRGAGKRRRKQRPPRPLTPSASRPCSHPPSRACRASVLTQACPASDGSPRPAPAGTVSPRPTGQLRGLSWGHTGLARASPQGSASRPASGLPATLRWGSPGPRDPAQLSHWCCQGSMADPHISYLPWPLASPGRREAARLQLGACTAQT